MRLPKTFHASINTRWVRIHVSEKRICKFVRKYFITLGNMPLKPNKTSGYDFNLRFDVCCVQRPLVGCY